jgi:aspartyl-tRNA(Asn)/glutamyl-tRNA(Gln) amidotransferase subunit C
MASRLTPDEVRRIAGLAHLALSDADVALFTDQLSSILTYADAVQRIDTTGIEPTAHVLNVESREREDVAAASLERRDWIGNAPDADAATGFFKVPKVL